MKDQPERNILLVDDNTLELQTIQNVLVRLGYKCDPKSSPTEALMVFKRKPYEFSMIITDQMMPEMRGDELAICARNIRKDIPIILCSGSEEAIQDLQDIHRDFQGFLLKPFSRDQLKSVIQNLA